MTSQTVRLESMAVAHAERGRHVREHRSVLAALEKRTLVWMAHRLPGWVRSDHLSLLGLSSMMLAGAAFAVARVDPPSLLLVVVALILNWFGDSLDGTLARVRNQQRPRYGFYVDHVIDVAGAVFLVGGIAASGYMHPLIGVSLLVAYLAVSAESFLATHALGVFRLSSFGLGPTELRIVLAMGVLRVLVHPTVTLGSFGTFLLFDVGGIVALAGLTAAFIVSASRNTCALYREEPLPARRA